MSAIQYCTYWRTCAVHLRTDRFNENIERTEPQGFISKQSKVRFFKILGLYNTVVDLFSKQGSVLTIDVEFSFHFFG